MGPKPLRNRAMALAVTGRRAIAELRALRVDEAGEPESERMETTTFRNNIMSDLDIIGDPDMPKRPGTRRGSPVSLHAPTVFGKPICLVCCAHLICRLDNHPPYRFARSRLVEPGTRDMVAIQI